MKRIHRWVAAHKRLAWVLYGITVCVGYTILLSWLKAPLWAIILLNLLLLAIDYFWVQSCSIKLVRQAEKVLTEHGDPDLLLEETAWLLSHKPSEYFRQVLLIDRCVALRARGEYQKTYEILKSINIDKCAETLPPVKVVYYNNLMDICALTDRIDEVNIWYEKMLLLYHDLKPKLQQQMNALVLSAQAMERYCAQDYAQTIQILESMPKQQERKAAIADTLLYAQACIALGDTETAKEKLAWVIANGNKLYAVQEARELMATLS